jgi:hypothetical protein
MLIPGGCADKRLPTGPVTTEPTSKTEYECVAILYDSDDRLFEAVIGILSKSNIECYIEGSISYDVIVKKVDAEKAGTGLREASELRGRGIVVRDGNNGWRTLEK